MEGKAAAWPGWGCAQGGDVPRVGVCPGWGQEVEAGGEVLESPGDKRTAAAAAGVREAGTWAPVPPAGPPQAWLLWKLSRECGLGSLLPPPQLCCPIQEGRADALGGPPPPGWGLGDAT